MNIFIKKSFLFLLPILIVILFPFLAFYNSGEFISTEKILEFLRSGKPVIVGKALPFWQDGYSKINILKIKKTAVITLGNSRVLQIRSKFFKDDDFYNGGGVGNLTGFKEALKQLNDEEKPKIIILGLEQSYFHPFSDEHEIPDLASENTQTTPLLYILSSWRSLYFNIFNGKYGLSQFFQSKKDAVERIGLIANIKNAGTRNDGSYDYGDICSVEDKRSDDYHFKDTLRRIEKGVNLFYHGNKISNNSIAILTDLLDYCKSRNIYVIGFLPPYAQEIYNQMRTSGQYEYIFNLEDKIKPIFKKRGFNLFDFSDMSSFGAEKNEIVDGMHASEKTYLRLLINMVERDHILREFTADKASLDLMLKTDYQNK